MFTSVNFNLHVLKFMGAFLGKISSKSIAEQGDGGTGVEAEMDRAHRQKRTEESKRNKTRR